MLGEYEVAFQPTTSPFKEKDIYIYTKKRWVLLGWKLAQDTIKFGIQSSEMISRRKRNREIGW